MSEDHTIIIANNAVSHVSRSQLKSHRNRKSTAGDRKIQHLWTDDEITRLIASVEQHRGLWDFDSSEYKIKKVYGWRSVVEEIGVDGVDAKEAKVKWSSLRTTYMVNLAKLKRNKSHIVTWKFFRLMMFLKPNNAQNSDSSTSTPQLQSNGIHGSIVEDFAAPSESVFTVGNLRKRSRSTTPNSSSSTSPSSDSSGSQLCSQSNSIFNGAVAALHSCDANSTFCDNLLAELRTLTETRARTLRYKISRMMMDFMEACQEPTQVPPVKFLRPNEQEGSVECFNTLIVEQANNVSENDSAFVRHIPLSPTTGNNSEDPLTVRFDNEKIKKEITIEPVQIQKSQDGYLENVSFDNLQALQSDKPQQMSLRKKKVQRPPM